MRGLFTKIFLGFWIAQSLTFTITTMLLVRHRFVRPNEIEAVLDATLPSAIATAINAYETGGCSALQQYADSLRQTIYLTDSGRRFLCGRLAASEANSALDAASSTPRVRVSQTDDLDLWSRSAESASGRRYFFVLTRPRAGNGFGLRDLLFFLNPQLP